MTLNFRESFFPKPWAFGVGWALFLAILALLPVCIVYAAADPFVLGKESLLRASIALLIGLMAGAACLGRRFRFTVAPVNGFVFLFLIWTLLTVFWSSSSQLAWEETGRLAFLVAAMLLFQSFARRSRPRIIYAAYAVMAASLGVAVWTVGKDALAGFSPGRVSIARTLGDWRDVVSSVALGNSGHVADFLAMGFFCWLAMLTASRSRVRTTLAVASLWLHSAGLIVAWSVHSNLSVIVGLVVFTLSLRHTVRSRQLKAQARRWVVLLGGWLLIIGFYVVDQPLNPHGSRYWADQTRADYAAMGMEAPEGGFSGGIFSQAFASPRWQAGGETRIVIWLTSLEMIRERPWLGWGGGNFTYVYPTMKSDIVLNDPRYQPYAGRWTNAAHNEALHFWGETGIVGLFLLIIICAIAVKRYWERLSVTNYGNAVILAGGLAALVAQLVQMQMSFPLQLPVSALMFFLLIGIPELLPRRGDSEEALLMPVERPYGPLELEVMMRNMSRPAEISLGLRFPGVLAQIAAVLFIALGAFWGWVELRPLRADIAYSEVRAQKRMLDAGVAARTRANCEALLPAARRVLEIWPGHGDARSAYQDLLLCSGDFEEVVAQTPIVLEKLNAVEVFARRAQALDSLGRTADADADWDTVFERLPEYGRMHPIEYREYLIRSDKSSLENR